MFILHSATLLISIICSHSIAVRTLDSKSAFGRKRPQIIDAISGLTPLSNISFFISFLSEITSGAKLLVTASPYATLYMSSIRFLKSRMRSFGFYLSCLSCAFRSIFTALSWNPLTMAASHAGNVAFWGTVSESLKFAADFVNLS